MSEKWTCRKCDHVNDPNKLYYSPLIRGVGQMMDMRYSDEEKLIRHRRRISQHCGHCGTKKPILGLATWQIGVLIALVIIVFAVFYVASNFIVW
jgi:hypothetical protein